MGNTVARSGSLNETWQYLCACWDNQAVHCKLSDQESSDVLRDLRIFMDAELGAAKMTDRLWYAYENQSHQKFLIRLQEQCSLILELIYQLRLSILEVKLKTVGGKGLPLPADLKHTTLYATEEEDIFEPDAKLSTKPETITAPEGDRVKVLRGLALAEIATIYHSLRSDINTAFQVISNSARVQIMSHEGVIEEHPQQTYFDQSIRTHLLRLGLMKPTDTLSQTRFYTCYLPVAIQSIFEVLCTIRPGAPRPYPSILPSYKPIAGGYVNNNDLLKNLSYEDRSLVHSFISSSTAKHVYVDPISSLPLLSSAPPFLHSPMQAPGSCCYNLQVSLANIIPESLVRLDRRITPLILNLSTSLLRIAHTQYAQLKKDRIRQASRPILNDINAAVPPPPKYPANLFMMVSACICTAGGKREWWSVTEPKPLSTATSFDIPLVTKYLPSTNDKKLHDIRHVLSSDNDVISPIDALALLNTTDSDNIDTVSGKKNDSINIYAPNHGADIATSTFTNTETSSSICSPTIRIVIHVLRLTTTSIARQRALPHNQQVHPLSALALNPDGSLYIRDDKDGNLSVSVDELDNITNEELCMEVVGTLGGIDHLHLSTIMNSQTLTQNTHGNAVFSPMKVPVTQLTTHLDPSDHENILISMDNSAPMAVNATCDIILTPVSIPAEAADHDLGTKQHDSAIYTSSIHISHVAGLCATGNNGYIVIPHAVMSLHRSLGYMSDIVNQIFLDDATIKGNSLLSAVNLCVNTVFGDWEGVCWLSFLLHHMQIMLASCKKRLAVYDLLCPGPMSRKHISPHNVKAVNRLHKSIKSFMSKIEEDVEDFGKASVTLVLGGDHTRDVVDPESAEMVYRIKEWGQRKGSMLAARATALEEGRNPEDIIDTAAPTPFDAANDILISFVPHPDPSKLHYYDKLPNKDKLYTNPFKLYAHTKDSTGNLPPLEYQKNESLSGMLKNPDLTEEKMEEVEEEKSFFGNVLSFGGLFGDKNKNKENKLTSLVKSVVINKDSKKTAVGVDYAANVRREVTPHPGIAYWPVSHPIPRSVQRLFSEKPIPECPAPPEKLNYLSSSELSSLSSQQRAEYERKKEQYENYPWILEQWKRAIEREEGVVPGHVMRGIGYDAQDHKVTLVRDHVDDIYATAEDILSYELALEALTTHATSHTTTGGDAGGEEDEIVVKKGKNGKKSRSVDVKLATKARKQALKAKEKHTKFLSNVWGAPISKSVGVHKTKDDDVVSGDDDMMVMIHSSTISSKKNTSLALNGQKPSLHTWRIDYHQAAYQSLQVLEPIEPSTRSTVPFSIPNTANTLDPKDNGSDFAYTYPIADEKLLKKARKSQRGPKVKARARAKGKKTSTPIGTGSMAADAFSPLSRSTSLSPRSARAAHTTTETMSTTGAPPGRRTATPAAGLRRSASTDGKGSTGATDRFGRVHIGYEDDDDEDFLEGMGSVPNATTEESVAVDIDDDNFDKLLDTVPDNDVLSDASSLGILSKIPNPNTPGGPPKPGMGPHAVGGSPMRRPPPIRPPSGSPSRPGIPNEIPQNPPRGVPGQPPRGPRPGSGPRGPRAPSSSADGRAGSPQPRFAPNHQPRPGSGPPQRPDGIPRGPPGRPGAPQRPGSLPRPANPSALPPSSRAGSQPRDGSVGRSPSNTRDGSTAGRGPTDPRPRGPPQGASPARARPAAPPAGASPARPRPIGPNGVSPAPVRPVGPPAGASPAQPRPIPGVRPPGAPGQRPLPPTGAQPPPSQHHGPQNISSQPGARGVPPRGPPHLRATAPEAPEGTAVPRPRPLGPKGVPVSVPVDGARGPAAHPRAAAPVGQPMSVPAPSSSTTHSPTASAASRREAVDDEEETEEENERGVRGNAPTVRGAPRNVRDRDVRGRGMDARRRGRSESRDRSSGSDAETEGGEDGDECVIM